jgi:multidrug efflux pump subunit AcrA (membrane-fusion protein)
VRPGGLEQVEVKTGLEGNGRLEVLEGVSEGDVVALP